MLEFLQHEELTHSNQEDGLYLCSIQNVIYWNFSWNLWYLCLIENKAISLTTIIVNRKLFHGQYFVTFNRLLQKWQHTMKWVKNESFTDLAVNIILKTHSKEQNTIKWIAVHFEMAPNFFIKSYSLAWWFIKYYFEKTIMKEQMKNSLLFSSWKIMICVVCLRCINCLLTWYWSNWDSDM